MESQVIGVEEAGKIGFGRAAACRAAQGGELGRANPATTLQHYAHWIPKKEQRWVQRPQHAEGRS